MIEFKKLKFLQSQQKKSYKKKREWCEILPLNSSPPSDSPEHKPHNDAKNGQ
jgi:hypothetical protein